jgi:hypothetical protein
MEGFYMAIDRRTALAVVAGAPVAAAAIPALAGNEDAELRRLWEELRAEQARANELLAAFHAKEKAALAGDLRGARGVAAAERRVIRCWNKLTALSDRIAETPAEGLTGVCIKLATCLALELDFMDRPVQGLVADAYAVVSRLTGMDPASQVTVL